MDKMYNAVIAEMQVLLDGQKFTQQDNIFKNENKAVKVYFNEQVKQFVLEVADVTDGTVGEFSVINTWLFDETQTERDAAAVGTDFADSLRQNLGVKKAKTNTQVELPSSEKNNAGNITGLTQKLLAVFPQFKEEYKQTVAENGKFLYLNFYMVNFVPAIKNMLATGTKKQVKKLLDMLNETYVAGNGETVDAVVALICAAIFENEQNTQKVMEHLSENKHLKTAVSELLIIIKKNKNLRAALIK